MAATSYGVNDPLSNKLWQKKLSVEALKQTWVSKFMGNDSSSIIQVKDETTKAAGDKITYGLRMQLQGTGVQGDATLEGSEEALTTYSDSVVINQIRHAVRTAGRMSQQRVPFDVRNEALSGLRDWYAARMDLSAFNQLCGNTVQVDQRFTGNNATVAPSTANYINQHGAGDDSSLTAVDTFNLNIIDYAIERAKTLDPTGTSTTQGVPIRPCMIGGDEYYVAVLHPYQVTSLRTSTTALQWGDIQKAALQGGEITDNPIFSGALGVYNNVALHSSARIQQGCVTTTAYANTRRAMFLGAQAAAVAFGRDNGPGKFTWVEELFDYENQLGVSAGSIFGFKKMVFNSMDFATIALSTYATSH